ASLALVAAEHQSLDTCFGLLSRPSRTGVRSLSRSRFRSQPELVLHCDRRVVGETFVLVDRLAPCMLRQDRRGQVVVEAPADVLGPGLATIAPPRVAGLAGFGLQPLVAID